MPAQNSAQQNAMNMLQQNDTMRRALLSTAAPMRKKLGKYGPFALGDSYRQKLFNVGIGTHIDIMVEATVDLTTTLTPSVRAPYNLIDRARLTDYDGTDRVLCSGYQLWLNRTMRQNANELNGCHNTPASTATETLPSVPTDADGDIRFLLTVPMAYEPSSDLRGAMMMQTDRGEAFLNLDFNRLGLGADDDAVYKAGTGVGDVITDIYVTVWQNYLAPVSIGGVTPLPLMDLSTVYELNGSLKTSANLSSGTEKLLDIPNARSVMATYIEFVNDGEMLAGSSNVRSIDIIANGNTRLQEWGVYDLANKIRENIGCDLPPGSYYMGTRARPIQTDQYGVVQIGFTPAAVISGNAYLNVMYEATYAKGTTLPGMQQG